MQRMRTATAIACAVGCLIGAGGATEARAGRYHVYSCRTPNGEAAPTDGWTKAKSGTATVAENECATGGGLVAGLIEGTAHTVSTDTATWTFTPPSGETLASATLNRAGDAEGGAVAGATYEFWFAGPMQAEGFGECVYVGGCTKQVGETNPRSSANSLSVPLANLGQALYVNASCVGQATYKCPNKGDGKGYAAVVYLYAADLTLEQSAQPVVENVGGELKTAATLSGTQDLSFEATDPGSGVYQAVFTLDGTEVGRTLLGENGGRCRDVGQTTDGLPGFLYLQPCAATLSADVPFDTAAFPDGSHHLVVSVTDAAGNASVALDRTVDFANHPAVQQPGGGGQTVGSTPPATLTAPVGASSPTLGAANGNPAGAGARLSARWAATTRTSLTARFGRAQSVSGTLLSPTGAPIASAAIQAQFLPAALGAHPQALAAVQTGAGGGFRLRLPAGTPSGRLTLAYSSHLGQATPDVTAALTLSVPASLQLRVAPTVSHAGGTIRFTGSLRGAPLPAGGKQLVLEARVPGGPWRQFQVLSTRAHGRYSASYRFRLPGPVVYQFRAVCPQEADFPYASGASNLVAVRER
jgi:hypothetical protein